MYLSRYWSVIAFKMDIFRRNCQNKGKKYSARTSAQNVTGMLQLPWEIQAESDRKWGCFPTAVGWLPIDRGRTLYAHLSTYGCCTDDLWHLGTRE